MSKLIQVLQSGVWLDEQEDIKHQARTHTTPFRVSGFGQCMRKRTYEAIGADRLPDCPETLLNFEMGNLIHSFIQDRIKKHGPAQGIKVLGEEIRFPIEGSPTPYDDLITGHLDLLTEENGKRIAYEIKSMHFMAMSRHLNAKGMPAELSLQKGYPHHHAQLSGYYHLLNLAGTPVDEAYIIYVVKSNMFSIAVPLILWDIEMEIDKMKEALTTYHQAEELPAPTPPQQWECKYCAYRHTCKQMPACNCKQCQAIRAKMPPYNV